jgi:hypothetical protein
VQQLALDAAPLVKETKSGYKTTEFWAAIAAVASTLILNLGTQNKYIIAGLAGIYAVARGIAKAGVSTTEK